jgi:hypothetical protein
MIASTASLALCFAYTYEYQFNFYFACAMCVSWGMQDGMSACFTQTLCGFQFDDKTLPFGVYQMVQNTSGFFCYLIDVYFKTQESYLIYFGALFVYEVAMYALIVFKFDFRTPVKVMNSEISDEMALIHRQQDKKSFTDDNR